MSPPPYSPEVLEHFRNPAHAGSFPRDAAGVVTGEAGDEASGRLVRMQLRVAPDATIREVRFKAFGCPATIASASFVAARLSGRGLADSGALTAAGVAEALALPASRRRAAELALEALARALERARGAVG